MNPLRGLLPRRRLPRLSQFPAQGQPRFASDLISEDHKHLPMLRVLLPVGTENDDLARWSAFVPLENAPAALEWWQVVERAREDQPHITEFFPATGELDAETHAALVDALGPMELSSLRWTGYGQDIRTRKLVGVFDTEYSPSAIRVANLEVERRIPEFAWDRRGRVAWGARLYGDSFVVAATPEIVRKLHSDPRIDTISIRRDVDVMPRSAGD
ncbi:MAG: hypothetical protein ACQEW8_04535 [Actinomycetota bacterium]